MVCMLMSCLTTFSQSENHLRITGLLNKEYAGLVELYWRRLQANPELSALEYEIASRMAMHTPFFTPDTEPTLRIGVASMSSAILYLLNNDHKKS